MRRPEDGFAMPAQQTREGTRRCRHRGCWLRLPCLCADLRQWHRAATGRGGVRQRKVRPRADVERRHEQRDAPVRGLRSRSRRQHHVRQLQGSAARLVRRQRRHGAGGVPRGALFVRPYRARQCHVGLHAGGRPEQLPVPAHGLAGLTLGARVPVRVRRRHGAAGDERSRLRTRGCAHVRDAVPVPGFFEHQRARRSVADGATTGAVAADGRLLEQLRARGATGGCRLARMETFRSLAPGAEAQAGGGRDV